MSPLRSKPLFDGHCGCPCGCKEWITPDERRACKGKCIACYGDFHGLQDRLRAASRLAALDEEGKR